MLTNVISSSIRKKGEKNKRREQKNNKTYVGMYINEISNRQST